jgi:transcriptional regulator of arginine metabolism
MDKQHRQEAILSLVQSQAIANQNELVDAVREAGFKAAQASISRDIRELGLVKVAGRYVRLAAVPGAVQARAPEAIAELITGFEPIGANMIVLRTVTGAAGTVAAGLDEHELREVAGSLAGDDTIFLAVRSRSDQGRLAAWLNAWIGTGGKR